MNSKFVRPDRVALKSTCALLLVSAYTACADGSVRGQASTKPASTRSAQRANDAEIAQRDAPVYEKRINDLLANTGVKAYVTVLPKQLVTNGDKQEWVYRFAVRLTGSAYNAQQKQDITSLVQAISDKLIISSFGITVVNDGAVQSRIDQALGAYKAAIDQKTNGTTASNALLPGVDGSYSMVLNGKLSREDGEALANYADMLAKIMLPGLVRVISKLEAIPPPPKPGYRPPESIMREYTLKFLRGSLPTGTDVSKPGDIDAKGKDSVATDVAAFLNSLYPGNKPKVAVNALENRLILQGDPKEVTHLRQLLALNLDVPSPQVRADVVIIQVNSSNKRPGSREQALRKMDEIRAGIQLVRDLSKLSRYKLEAYVKKNASRGITPDVSVLLNKVGFDPDPKRPLSIAEMLIFAYFLREDLHRDLGDNGVLSNEFQKLLADAEKLLEKEPTHSHTETNRSTAHPSTDPNLEYWAEAETVRQHRNHLWRLVKTIEQRVSFLKRAKKPLLPRLLDGLVPSELNDRTTAESDTKGLKTFLNSWVACKLSFTDGTDYDVRQEQLADALSASSAATDRVLKQAMDAFTSDMQELFIDPLLQWIRDDVQAGSAKDSGIDIVGHTSIVVRDRTLATSSGKAESYFPFTQIPKLSQQSLTDALTLSNGNNTSDGQQSVAHNHDGSIVKDANGKPQLLSRGEDVVRDKNGDAVLTNGAPTIIKTNATKTPTTVLGAITPIEALLLQGAFAEQNAVTTFTQVIPGIDLAIRPFVLPNGGSARVQLNLTTKVEGDVPSVSNTATRGRPLDRIQSQSTTTEATVDAYELMELSTFGVQTSTLGDHSWRIPLLDQLPLLGNSLFTGPRTRETHRQESIALITLSIVPRSLDLVPYLDYSKATAIPESGKPPAPSAKPAEKPAEKPAQKPAEK